MFRKSHPSWVCGLKLLVVCINPKLHLVTPFVGVWIETLHREKSMMMDKVTPFVGVWIETLLGGLFGKSNTVTPFVGVWIET